MGEGVCMVKTTGMSTEICLVRHIKGADYKLIRYYVGDDVTVESIDGTTHRGKIIEISRQLLVLDTATVLIKSVREIW